MITTEKQYHKTLNEIDLLMKKGEGNISDKDTTLLKSLIADVSAYEEDTIILPAPKTVIEMVELKLFQKKMTQAELARKSGISLPKINQILKGKRPIDISFLKAVYNQLQIPAEFLLKKV